MNKKLYVARSPRIAARKLGEEMLVMSAQGSTLFTLNPTATILWQAADGVTALDEIVERRICPEFAVQPEEAKRDAQSLAEELANMAYCWFPKSRSQIRAPLFRSNDEFDGGNRGACAPAGSSIQRATRSYLPLQRRLRSLLSRSPGSRRDDYRRDQTTAQGNG